MITRLLWSFWWELENFSRGGFEKPSGFEGLSVISSILR